MPLLDTRRGKDLTGTFLSEVYIVEYTFSDDPVVDKVIDVMQGVGAVAGYTDPYLEKTVPVLILIWGGDGFTSAFPFSESMYDSHDQYWDAVTRFHLVPGDGEEPFIKKKGKELLDGYLRPNGSYVYYSNDQASDTSTYKSLFNIS